MLPAQKTTLKIIAIAFTILSGMLAMSTSFGINNYLISNLPKYQNLERAVVTLSDFSYQNVQERNFSLLSQNDIGFGEFLSVIYNKIAIPYDKREVAHISMLKTGTYIGIGGFDATPQYILGISINGTFKGIAAMHLNDIQTWIHGEKQNDLQKSAFLMLIIAITCDLVSDSVKRERVCIRGGSCE